MLLLGAVVLMLLTTMKDDRDEEVVAKACEALQGVLTQVGPMGLTPHLNDVMQMTAQLLADKVEHNKSTLLCEQDFTVSLGIARQANPAH